MDGSENRQIARDSLFLMAELRMEGLAGDHRIKVRNLSDGGMMGEGDIRVRRGCGVEINIRNVGWINGTVAWVQDSRFGVSFLDPIDPRLARSRPAGDDEAAPRFTRSPSQSFQGNVRKI